jgi:hypothetical protein
MVNDATLVGLISTRIHNVQAPKDEVFPYIVHRLELTRADEIVMVSGFWTVDLWDQNTDQSDLLDIKERIITLLDFRSFSTDGSVQMRMKLDMDESVPEEVYNIRHRILRFSVRGDRKQDISNILNR